MKRSTTITWEFLNSDNQWVHCIGGESHAVTAARDNGTNKIRQVVTTTEREEFDV